MSDQVPWGAPLPPQPPTGRPFYKKKRYIIPAALLVLFVAIGASGNSGQKSGQATAVPSSGVAISTVGPTAAPTVDPAIAAAQASQQAAVEASASASAAASKAAADKAAADQAAADKAAADQAAADAAKAAAEEAAKGTLSQQNAYKSAVSYLGISAFSRVGLLKQLTSSAGEGFPAADAEFAIKRLEREGGVNWNDEAAKSAKDYLSQGSFSHASLLEQLESSAGEGFTPAQAAYGVKQAGL